MFCGKKKATKEHSAAGALAFALGKGIIAGLAGTAAITISQMIEMKITERKASTAPADAASKALDVKPASEADKAKFSQEVHWAYGTSWGIVRGLISLTGLKGLPASLAHFSAVWGAAMVVLPKLEVAPPVEEWEAKTVALDGLHHLIYAVVAGLVYDVID